MQGFVRVLGTNWLGRPRRRWVQNMGKDLNKIKERKWKELIQQTKPENYEGDPSSSGSLEPK